MPENNLQYSMDGANLAEAPSGVKLSISPEDAAAPQAPQETEVGAQEVAEGVAQAREEAMPQAEEQTQAPELSVIQGGGEQVEAPAPDLSVVEQAVPEVPVEMPEPEEIPAVSEDVVVDPLESVEEATVSPEVELSNPEVAEVPTDLDSEIAEYERVEEEQNEKAEGIVEIVRSEKARIQRRKLARAEEHKGELQRFRKANAMDDESIARFEKIEADLLKKFGLKAEDSKKGASHQTQEHKKAA